MASHVTSLPSAEAVPLSLEHRQRCSRLQLRVAVRPPIGTTLRQKESDRGASRADQCHRHRRTPCRRSTAEHLARLLRDHRAAIGTRQGRRALGCFWQAVLILPWVLDGTPWPNSPRTTGCRPPRPAGTCTKNWAMARGGLAVNISAGPACPSHAQFVGDTGQLAAFLVGGPLLGEVQAPADQAVSAVRGEGEAHRDLAQAHAVNSRQIGLYFPESTHTILLDCDRTRHDPRAPA